ncbi:hypothetical protein [Candidatus Nitrosocosmicus sp. T]
MREPFNRDSLKVFLVTLLKFKYFAGIVIYLLALSFFLILPTSVNISHSQIESFNWIKENNILFSIDYPSTWKKEYPSSSSVWPFEQPLVRFSYQYNDGYSLVPIVVDVDIYKLNPGVSVEDIKDWLRQNNSPFLTQRMHSSIVTITSYNADLKYSS